jgi:undecaprenyl-diphosphatase
MNWLEALILGLVQGLTEFLPVSSSGHLELGKAILGIDAERSLIFTILVHGATVLSTIVVFRKDLWILLKELFAVRWKDLVAFRFTESMQYNLKLILSMVPVVILGLFFLEEIESLFTGRVVFVGYMLIITSILLASTYLIKSNKRNIGYLDSLFIGIAQAIAVIPGISRSGATISTGLLLGTKRELVTKFSFLMVLIPILGENATDLLDADDFRDVHQRDRSYHWFFSGFHRRIVRLQMDDRHRKKGEPDLFFDLLPHHRADSYFLRLNYGI